MVQLSTNRFFCVNHKQPLSLVYDILRKHLHKSNRLFTYPRRCLYFLVNEISGKSKGISSQTFTEVIVFSWTGCNPNAHAIDFYHLGISWRSKLNSRVNALFATPWDLYSHTQSTLYVPKSCLNLYPWIRLLWRGWFFNADACNETAKALEYASENGRSASCITQDL